MAQPSRPSRATKREHAGDHPVEHEEARAAGTTSAAKSGQTLREWVRMASFPVVLPLFARAAGL